VNYYKTFDLADFTESETQAIKAALTPEEWDEFGKMLHFMAPEELDELKYMLPNATPEEWDELKHILTDPRDELHVEIEERFLRSVELFLRNRGVGARA
jgi:hypothetical protein